MSSAAPANEPSRAARFRLAAEFVSELIREFYEFMPKVSIYEETRHTVYITFQLQGSDKVPLEPIEISDAGGPIIISWPHETDTNLYWRFQKADLLNAIATYKKVAFGAQRSKSS